MTLGDDLRNGGGLQGKGKEMPSLQLQEGTGPGNILIFVPGDSFQDSNPWNYKRINLSCFKPYVF